MSSEAEDAWAEIQAQKLKRHSRRRKIEERKKGRSEILTSTNLVKPISLSKDYGFGQDYTSEDGDNQIDSVLSESGDKGRVFKLQDFELEISILSALNEMAVKSLPVDSRQLLRNICLRNEMKANLITQEILVNYLQKFAAQEIIRIQTKKSASGTTFEISQVDQSKIVALTSIESKSRKRKATATSDPHSGNDDDEALPDKTMDADNVQMLLSMASSRERENKRIGEEILELLSRPTAKEKTLAEKFRSQGGTTVRQFCAHGTKGDCRKINSKNQSCDKLHFRKIIQAHTDESLGDCSFLNTCFHMESCKYVHYEVDSEKHQSSTSISVNRNLNSKSSISSAAVMHQPQWILCDLRYFDMTILGKFSVIMADPPWDIHMELPYGTLSDDEMRQLNIPALQDEGLIFLWVTGRAMELGRECLELWGYERVDELIWVKTNQLQRIIRTGRTGHWLNHGKEHCLVGMKGNPEINRGLDADVIVAEVRATSHKPDEVYGIIERLSPGTRKIELFGRPHNIQPNWVTLGNQLEKTHIVDEQLLKRFYAQYPDGDCMKKTNI